MKEDYIGTIGLLYRRQFRKLLRRIGVDYFEFKNWGNSLFFGKLNDEQKKLLEEFSDNHIN